MEFQQFKNIITAAYPDAPFKKYEVAEFESSPTGLLCWPNQELVGEGRWASFTSSEDDNFGFCIEPKYRDGEKYNQIMKWNGYEWQDISDETFTDMLGA